MDALCQERLETVLDKGGVALIPTATCNLGRPERCLWNDAAWWGLCCGTRDMEWATIR